MVTAARTPAASTKTAPKTPKTPSTSAKKAAAPKATGTASTKTAAKPTVKTAAKTVKTAKPKAVKTSKASIKTITDSSAIALAPAVRNAQTVLAPQAIWPFPVGPKP